jgi:hypothetical protein
MENKLVVGSIYRGTPGEPGFRIVKEETCDECNNVLDFADSWFGHECD